MSKLRTERHDHEQVWHLIKPGRFAKRGANRHPAVIRHVRCLGQAEAERLNYPKSLVGYTIGSGVAILALEKFRVHEIFDRSLQGQMPAVECTAIPVEPQNSTEILPA